MAGVQNQAPTTTVRFIFSTIGAEATREMLHVPRRGEDVIMTLREKDRLGTAIVGDRLVGTVRNITWSESDEDGRMCAVVQVSYE